MKAILFIAIMALATVPRGSNLITIESELEGFELFQSVVMELMEQGYTFENMDKDFMFLTTAPISPRRMNFEYKLDVRVMKNRVQVRSFVRSLESFSARTTTMRRETENVFERGANRSLGTSMWRYGWNKSMELAEKIPGEINYFEEE